MFQRLAQPPYRLDRKRRPIVLNAIRQVCRQREWGLLAAHVRSSHLHAVVRAATELDEVVKILKRACSRALSLRKIDPRGRRRWVRGASKRYLWNHESVQGAVYYVVQGQGEPMSVFPDPDNDLDLWLRGKLEVD